MRLISIGDDKGKNAMVGIASYWKKQEKPKEEKKYASKRVIKATLKTDISTLEMESGYDDEVLFEKLLKEDPEIDLKEEGKFVDSLHYTYTTQKNELASDVRFEEQILSPEGTLMEQRMFNANESNIQNENMPVRWSGITIPVYEALRRYVFTHVYQLFHTNGLTYSFLYEMAKELEEKKLAMFVGAGAQGTDPIVLIKGGKKYRGFMTGQTEKEGRYKLLIHLTEIDLENY